MWKAYFTITVVLAVVWDDQRKMAAGARPLVVKKVVIESLMQCCGRSCTLLRPETITNGKPTGIKFKGTTVNYTTRFVMKHGHRFNWKLVSIHWEHNTTYALAVRDGKIVIEPARRVQQANLFLQKSSSQHSYLSLRSQVAPFGYISSDANGNVLLRNCRNAPFSWMKINTVK